MARQRWFRVCAAGLLTRRGRTPPIGDGVRQSARRLRRAAAHTSRTAAVLTCTVLVALVLAGSASAQQDTWAGVERIVAVGDVHGDFDQFVKTLRAAYEIGKKEGLRYLYIGNMPGEPEDTHCPNCGEALIRRRGFFVAENKVMDSRCPVCSTTIAGIL